jgi:hypothetical protein
VADKSQLPARFGALSWTLADHWHTGSLKPKASPGLVQLDCIGIIELKLLNRYRPKLAAKPSAGGHMARWMDYFRDNALAGLFFRRLFDGQKACYWCTAPSAAAWRRFLSACSAWRRKTLRSSTRLPVKLVERKTGRATPCYAGHASLGI